MNIKIVFIIASILTILNLAYVAVKWLESISRSPESDKVLFVPAIIVVSMLEFMALLYIVLGVII